MTKETGGRVLLISEVWVGFKWWSLDQVIQTTDVVWPAELPAVLRDRDMLANLEEPLVFEWDQGR